MLPPWVTAGATGGGTGGTALILPTLQLVFPPGGPMPPGVAVTRASVKEQEYPAGTVTSLGNNVGSLESAGLVVEAAHTNELLSSHDAANWTGNAATVTAAAAVAPDGTTTAVSVLTQTGNVGSYAFQASQAAGDGSAHFTVSMWLRAATSMTVYLSVQDSASVYTTTTCAVTTAWQRFTVNALPATGTFYVVVGNRNSGSPLPVETFYFWGGQVESGTWAHSLAPTVNTVATCAQDAPAVAAIPTLAGNKGRVVVTFTPEWAVPVVTAALLDTRASGLTGVALTVATSTGNLVATLADGSGTSTVTATGLTWVAGTQYVVMLAWNAGTATTYINGTQVGTANSQKDPSGSTSMTLGTLDDGSDPLNGRIASVSLFAA